MMNDISHQENSLFDRRENKCHKVLLHHLNGCPFSQTVFILLNVLGYDLNQVVWTGAGNIKRYKREVNTETGLFPMVEFDGKKIIESNVIINLFIESNPDCSLAKLTDEQIIIQDHMKEKVYYFHALHLAYMMKDAGLRTLLDYKVVSAGRSMVWCKFHSWLFLSKKFKSFIAMMPNGAKIVNYSKSELFANIRKTLQEFNQLIESQDPMQPFLLGFLSTADFFLAGFLLSTCGISREKLYNEYIHGLPGLIRYLDIFSHPSKSTILHQALITT